MLGQIAITVAAVLFLWTVANSVMILRGSDKNYRRKLITHIDRELSKIELTARRDASIDEFRNELLEIRDDAARKLKSMQGQISRAKAPPKSESVSEEEIKSWEALVKRQMEAHAAQIQPELAIDPDGSLYEAERERNTLQKVADES
jgi:hypothetical protein